MSEPWLPAEHGSDTGRLQKRVARGLTWTLIDTWGSQLLALVIFVVLARLLSAADFGLVALAAVFIFFAQLIVDQGLGDALIQRRSLTRSHIDTAFWASMAMGGLLTIVGLLLAAPIAALLDEPRLAPILQVLSLTFVLAALNSIQLALLRREMAFRSLAVRRLVAVTGGGAVGISFALAGYGVWALVAQQLANAALSVLMLWRVSPWRPSRHVSRSDFRDLFSFGINVVAGDILHYFSRNMDNLLIGIFLGTVPLGFYAVAYRILDTSQALLVNAARKLAFPVFSRLQNNPDRIRRAYLRAARGLSVVFLPGYIGLALVAQEAIVVIFGERWLPSAPVATMLFLIGPVLTVQLFSGAVLNAVGRPEVTFRIRLITSIVNVTGFFIAVTVFRDIVAVAAAFVVRGYLVMPLVVYWLWRYVGIPISAHVRQLFAPAFATAVMALAVIGVKITLLGNVHSAVLLATEIGVGVVVFVAAMAIFDRRLLVEVAALFLQAAPGSDRLARRLGVPVAHERPRRNRKAALDADAAAAADDVGLAGGRSLSETDA